MQTLRIVSLPVFSKPTPCCASSFQISACPSEVLGSLDVKKPISGNRDSLCRRVTHKLNLKEVNDRIKIYKSCSSLVFHPGLI